MTPTAARLEAVEQALNEALQHLHSVAAAAGPDALDDWDALLSRVCLVPSPKVVRLQRYQSLRITRGALPDEFRAAVQVAARQASAQLAEIREADPEGTGNNGVHRSRYGLLHARLVDLVSREGGIYDAHVRPPKPGGGLGGVFARARNTSAVDPFQKGYWADNITLSCVSCGAPQHVALDFLCQYCGKQLFQRGIGWE